MNKYTSFGSVLYQSLSINSIWTTTSVCSERVFNALTWDYLCAWAPKSPAGPLSCRNTAPVVCLACHIIWALSHLAIVSPIVCSLSETHSLSLFLSHTGSSGYYFHGLDLRTLLSPLRRRKRHLCLPKSWRNKLGAHAHCVLRLVSFWITAVLKLNMPFMCLLT